MCVCPDERQEAESQSHFLLKGSTAVNVSTATTPELIAFAVELLKSEGMSHEDWQRLALSPDLRANLLLVLRDFSDMPELSPLTSTTELAVRMFLSRIKPSTMTNQEVTAQISEWIAVPDGINQLLDSLVPDERIVVVRNFGLLTGRPRKIATISQALLVPERVLLVSRTRALRRLRVIYARQVSGLPPAEIYQSSEQPPSEELSLERLGLQTRYLNALKRGGIRRVSELVNMSDAQLRQIPRINADAVDEIRAQLAAHGFPQATSS